LLSLKKSTGKKIKASYLPGSGVWTKRPPGANPMLKAGIRPRQFFTDQPSISCLRSWDKNPDL
jgi:hypothetical protein